MSISIVIRTHNEARHLPRLLEGIAGQQVGRMPIETIVVDSGSDDGTVEIARSFDSRLVHILKSEFTFGRSLNMGCEVARGDYLVFVSGHCIPEGNRWLHNIVQPLATGVAAYSYGRQIGDDSSRFSECQLFRKYYPETSRIQSDDFFCNNANAALLRSVWERHRFDEELTGLEDMELASRLVRQAMKIAYVADATVLHLHDERWGRVRLRYEREAMALQRILPQVHVSFLDFCRYFTSAVLLDFQQAFRGGVLTKHAADIVLFRLMQFWGSFRGNHEHRRLSREMKEKYFYPV
jgi:glycosyltransferase involved in cell wall biosynthesis